MLKRIHDISHSVKISTHPAVAKNSQQDWPISMFDHGDDVLLLISLAFFALDIPQIHGSRKFQSSLFTSLNIHLELSEAYPNSLFAKNIFVQIIFY